MDFDLLTDADARAIAILAIMSREEGWPADDPDWEYVDRIIAKYPKD